MATTETAISIWQKVSRTEFPEQDLRPERYKIKARGFEGPIDTVQKITGVVLAVRAARWLPEAETADSDAPNTQCELIEPGIGRWVLAPGDSNSATEERPCSECPMNRWGTATNGGKGKACREKRLLLVLRDGEDIPVVVVAPPTSILPVAQFETRAAARRLRLGQIHVQLSTTYQKSGQMEWGVLAIEELGVLDEKDQADLVQRLLKGPVSDMYQSWTRPLVHQDAGF